MNLSHTRTPGYWVQVPLETTAGQGASLDYPMDQVNLAVLKELREGG